MAARLSRRAALVAAPLAVLALAGRSLTAAPGLRDISAWRQDLTTPAVEDGPPAAGKRVRLRLPERASEDLFHTLYLPPDWRAGQRYPVLCEYPGNGPYRNALGDVNSGRVEDCDLGYGASGGKGWLWVTLPFVNTEEQRHQLQWWGDAEATVNYCLAAVQQVCRDYGGDDKRLVLAGFSRGAIACNYIGLRNDRIARLWRAFLVHSHYDGVRRWPYADSDEASARARLARLAGRPQYVTHEGDIAATSDFLTRAGVGVEAVRVALPFPNHTGAWLLRDLPERAALRAWLARVIA